MGSSFCGFQLEHALLYIFSLDYVQIRLWLVVRFVLMYPDFQLRITHDMDFTINTCCEVASLRTLNVSPTLTRKSNQDGQQVTTCY